MDGISCLLIFGEDAVSIASSDDETSARRCRDSIVRWDLFYSISPRSLEVGHRQVQHEPHSRTDGHGQLKSQGRGGAKFGAASVGSWGRVEGTVEPRVTCKSITPGRFSVEGTADTPPRKTCWWKTPGTRWRYRTSGPNLYPLPTSPPKPEKTWTFSFLRFTEVIVDTYRMGAVI